MHQTDFEEQAKNYKIPPLDCYVVRVAGGLDEYVYAHEVLPTDYDAVVFSTLYLEDLGNGERYIRKRIVRILRNYKDIQLVEPTVH